MMLLPIIVTWYVSKACQYYDNLSYWSNIVSELENSNYNKIQLLKQQGIGFWLNYYPNLQKTIGNNLQNPNNYFLFVLQNSDSPDFQILIQLSFDKIQKTIQLIAEFQAQNSVVLEVDVDNFEGFWNLLYLFIDSDQGLLQLNIYNSQSHQILSKQNYGNFQFSDQLKYSNTGEYYYFKDGNQLHLNPFQGQIGSLFNTQSKNIIQNIELMLSDCPIIYNCQQNSQQLVSFNVQYNSKANSIIQTYYPLIKLGYSISGWIKLTKLNSNQNLNTTILRVTNSKQYSNQQKFGDRLLFIQYHQNKLSGLNGFTLQSNSYTFPEPEDSYEVKDQDFIRIQGSEYREAIESWHYFQYEQYTNNNNGQPIYKVEFPKINLILELSWQQPVNQFSNTFRYFLIGGDDYSTTYFSGYLSDWTFTSYCAAIDLEFQKKCHFSCQTCNGITQQDCLTCNDAYHRIYSSDEKICQCEYGYLEQDNDGKCLGLNEYNLAFSITEIEIKCAKKGYYQCDENNILCDYGYFKAIDQCIQCPYFEQNNELIIHCGDCILYPEQFSVQLQCTFDFLTLDNTPQSPYVHQPRVYDDYDQFILKLDLQLNYRLELMIGHLTQTQCKSNHFLDVNGNCSPCLYGCQGCSSQEGCNQCNIGYNLVDNRICQKCTMCHACFLKNGQEICQYSDDCKSNQYWTGTGCYDCGQNCGKCTEQECLQCASDKNYFLTFDRWNCGLCQIKDCQFCFQYFYFEDKLYSTFDYSNKFDSSKLQILQGCGLCKQNMFFNFQTQQCEQQPPHYEYCTSGLIDLQKNVVCLKSSEPLLGIQQVQCDKLQNCKECILEYQNNNDYCIVCDDGYYSTILTGQCMACPENCTSCLQQSQNYNNSYFWYIKATYKYLVNQDGTHSFEEYAYPDQNFQIVCLNCDDDFILTNNECTPTCNQNCKDCKIIYHFSNSQKLSTCFQCKNTIYGRIKSLNIADYSYSTSYDECSKCSELCEACVFRSQSEIDAINPFFSQINFMHQTSLCFSLKETISSYQSQFSNKIQFQPRLRQLSICQQYQKCIKSLNRQLQVYCNTNLFRQAQNSDKRPNSSDIYSSYYEATVFKFFEDISDQFYQFLNQQLIEEVNINFHIIDKELDNEKCAQYMGNSNKMTSQYQSQVFSINEVRFNYIGNSGENHLASVRLQSYFSFQNFSTITIDQINFTITKINIFSSKKELYPGFDLTNPFQPITFQFQNSILSMPTLQFKFQFQFNCSNTKNVVIENVTLISLNLTNSHVFNFSLQKQEIQASMKVKNLTIQNLNLTHSSIFYFDATQFSLQYDILIEDVTIINSILQLKSQFINSSFLIQYDIGTITLKNFYFENITMQNSSTMFNLLSTKSCKILNFTIKNVTFNDQSSFAFLNIINIQGILVQELTIQNGILITNDGTKSQTLEASVNSRQVYLENLQFIRITYGDTGGFLKIVQNLEQNLQLQIAGLFLDDNKYFKIEKGIYTQSYLSFDQSLISIDCSKCNLLQTKIIRGIGWPEIIIQNSYQLTISDISIQQNKKYIQKVLHTSIDCIRPFLYLDIIYTLYFEKYHEVTLDFVRIENSIVFDSPFIIFGSANIISATQSNLISIKNSRFFQNMLVITKQNKYTAILAISTEQGVNITFQNCNFSENFLNEYQKDQQLYSSSTILVNAQLGNVVITDCEFTLNTVTNSSDSNLFIKSNLLVIQNSNFFKQNTLKQQIFLQYLYLSKTQIEVTQIVLDNFLILSQGGNGYFVINEFKIANLTIINSQALNGGAFYIITQQQGNILINNSSFFNTSTVFNGYQLSSGGCFYIDSSKSRLSLVIRDSQFLNISSRTFGGLIYIEPSHQDNQIQFDSLSIKQVFSIQHAILSYSPSRLSSVTSDIYITNCFVSNQQFFFDSFLSQLEDISSQDIEPFQRESAAIYVQYSNITISNCSFSSYHIAFMIEVYQGQNIELRNLLITNCTIFLTPLIRISMRESLLGNVVIENILISNITHFIPQTITQCNTQFSNSQSKDLKCPEDYTQSAQNIQFAQLTKNFNDLLSCNQQLLYEENSYNYSLFEIQNVNDKQLFYLDKVSFMDVSCQNCYFGLLSFMEFKLSQKIIFLQNIQISNNYCGIIGCLSLLKTSNIYIDDSKNRLLQQKNELIQQIENKNVQVELANSIFINNTAHFGGACYFQDVNILVKQCQFVNNLALYKGGAIYYESTSYNILLIETSITNNYAKIAGGLRITNLPIQVYQNTSVYLVDNTATFQADNSLSFAQHLEVLFSQTLLKKVNILQNRSTMIDEIAITPYYYLGQKIQTNVLLLPSGIKISNYKYFDATQNSYVAFNLSLRLKAFNELFEWMKNLNDSYCTISAAPVNASNLHEKLEQISSTQTTQFITQTQVQFNSTTQDYNLDDLIVYFNPYNATQTLQIAFYCNSIKIPQYQHQFPYELDYVINTYYLIMHVKTFPCQLGEYFNETSGGCVQCDVTQNQFSVTKNALSCSFKDEQKMIAIQSALIQLRSGFWRAYYYSTVIESCYHAEKNCLGGWSSGNPSCSIGHIGALCEQCDIYNIVGAGQFSISQQYSCSSCNEVAKNIINIIFVCLWTLLSVSLSVNSTVWMIEDFIFQLKIRALYPHYMIKSTSTSVLLKVFTNYLQIISSITSFQLTIPQGITLVVKGVGTPMDSMQFSLDCYLAKLTSVSIIYFRIIFSLLTIGMYILLFYVIYLFNLLIKKGKTMSITFVTTTFIYIYIYLFPNIISGLVGLLSYRIISEEYWIAGNVSYLYNTEEHKIWLASFVIPAFSVFGLLIPFQFWFFVYYNRKKLNNPKTRKLWGYLYNEYKIETYYWETIKILQKELIIIVLLYYADYVAIKASLVFVILYIYSHLTSKQKPYQTADLNKMDYQSTSICSISIVLASSIYAAQSYNIFEVVYPFYSILCILNFYFIINIIMKLLLEYFGQIVQNFDDIKIKIYTKFPTLINSSKQLKRFFTNTQNKNDIIKQRFKMLKQYLLLQARQIIEFKISNNIDIATSKITKRSEQTNITEPLSNTPRYTTKLMRYTRGGSKLLSNFSIQKIQESKQE